MRTPLIAGNWKMNLTFTQAQVLISDLRKMNLTNNCDVWVFPPHVYLQNLLTTFSNSTVQIGAQSLNEHDSGAYTGEISAQMLNDITCKHVLIGHSERRQYYNENNQSCNRKIQQALTHNIHPIYCIGETLDQRESNTTLSVITSQLRTALNSIPTQLLEKGLSIAYEPVWAIGTGKVATPEQAQDVHLHIRNELSTLISPEFANNTRILYGGSVKVSNSSELLKQPDIDGALVGSASLNSKDFSEIIKNAITKIIENIT